MNGIKDAVNKGTNVLKKPSNNIEKLATQVKSLPSKKPKIALGVSKKGPSNDTPEKAKKVECPKPKESVTKIHLNNPIEIRIRESRYIDTGLVSVATLDKVEFNPLNKSFSIDFTSVSDAYAVISKLATLVKKTNVYFDIVDGVMDFFDYLNDQNSNYIYGMFTIKYTWYVKRKEIDVKFPNLGYIRLFKVDQDAVGGILETLNTDITGKKVSYKIAERNLLRGGEPLGYRIYYKNFNDNVAIAKDVASFLWGAPLNSSFILGHTKLKYKEDQNKVFSLNDTANQRDIVDSDFSFGSYLYYKMML